MILFWVRVPVLSVQRVVMAPRLWMELRRFTTTFLLAILFAPLARLAVTIMGSISGVSPTAIEMAKSKASSQSPFVNPLMRKTMGAIVNMKRMRTQLMRLIPMSKVVGGGGWL